MILRVTLFILILVVLISVSIMHHYVVLPNRAMFNFSHYKKQLKHDDIPVISTSRVVISFSTIPARIKYIDTVIGRLLQQSFLPDTIYICIPYFSKRKHVAYEIPEWLLNKYDSDSIVRIVRCEDYGPATKLMGCIPFEVNPETIIITIDDDQIYAKDTIKTLIRYSNEYPDRCISGSGFYSVSSRYPLCYVLPGYNPTSPIVNYIEGFSTVLYRRGFISKEMLDYFNSNALSKSCFMSDDLTISTWLRKQGIQFFIACDIERSTDTDIDIVTPLHQEDRDDVYKTCGLELENTLNMDIL